MKKDISLPNDKQAIKQRIFLEHFREAGFISESAKIAGVSRQIIYFYSVKLIVDIFHHFHDFFAARQSACILAYLTFRPRGGEKK